MNSRKPHVVIVTPASSASSKNGNWQTTARWCKFLEPLYEVSIVDEWTTADCDLLIALHAKRSADSITRFANAEKRRPLVVVLTGTDLYRDIPAGNAEAIHSLKMADRLVALQSEAKKALSPEQQAKCTVIEQSAPTVSARPYRPRTFDLVMVGHMRPEKDPLTALRAVSRLDEPTVRLRHAGRTDDPSIGPTAVQLSEADPRIELLGSVSHAQSRDLIRESRLLLLPSLMEGGANVLIEAVTSSVPVLASEIPGSIGMLGESYDGYFPVGDDKELAKLIHRCMTDNDFYARLKQQCDSQAPLFHPDREQENVRKLVAELLM